MRIGVDAATVAAVTSEERTMEPKTIEAAKFKEQCLSLIDTLAPEGLVITRRGMPVARVLPYCGRTTQA